MNLKKHLHPRFTFCYSLSTDSVQLTGLLSCLQKPNVLLGNSFVENACGLTTASVPSSRQSQWNSDPEVQGKGFLAGGWGASFWMFTVFDMTELFWRNHLSYTVPSPAAYPFAPAEKNLPLHLVVLIEGVLPLGLFTAVCDLDQGRRMPRSITHPGLHKLTWGNVCFTDSWLYCGF